MKYRAFALFANFLLCCTLHVELAAQTVVAQSPYRFQNFDTKDGLPSAFVGSIAQDSLGFIWLQYYLGLSRFDGYNFKVYRHDPNDTIRSLPGGGIGFVLTDPKGNLWVTPHTRIQEYFPISKYDFKTDSFIKYKPRVNGTIVTDICFDKTNPVIWFATVGKGLFSFNIESLETKAYSNSHSDSTISTRRNAMWSISDRDTCILVGSSEGLWKFDKKTNTFGRPRYNTESVLLYSTSIWDIDDGPNSNHNDLWLGLSDKLLHVDADLSVLEWFDFPDGFRPKGHQRDKEGIIWLSTWDDQGLYRYNPVDNSLINIRNIPGDINSVRSNKINSIHVDKDQNIWIGSDLGVSRLQRQRLRFYNFTIAGGMGESTVYHQDKNDFAVITRTNNDSQEILIAPLIPGRFDYLRFKKITQFKRNLVCGLWQGKRNFWVSVHHQGIRGFPIDTISGMILPEPHQLLSHDPENKNTISSNLTTFVWEDRHEILWVGTRDGLNKVNLRIPYGREGSVVRYKHIDDDPNSLGNDIVWNVYPEDENAFWVITDTGADLFRNGHFEHFYEGDTAPTLY
ncbi:MAG: two-component regulator propeller domain-containing protein, partial [Cyclobacteriaceae bacterium]